MINNRRKKFTAAFLLSLACFASGCVYSARSERQNPSSEAEKPFSALYKAPRKIADLADKAIDESSGIAASRTNKNVFWTHNDSGDEAFLYAFDLTGKKLGVWKIAGAKNVDWEEITADTDRKTGENYLLIGDIGNNQLDRAEMQIYRVAEPRITDADAESTRKNPRLINRVETLKFSYPEARQNSETMFVNPANNDLYIISKVFSGDASVYKLAAPLDFANKQTLQFVSTLALPSLTKGLLTGGGISPDGKRIILSDYLGGYEYTLPPNAKNFDEIWQTKGDKIDLGEREQGEAVCYSPDGKKIYATSEKTPTPLIEVERK